MSVGVRKDLSRFIKVVYYVSRKLELKKRRKNEYRCDERRKTKDEESTCLFFIFIIHQESEN